MRHTLLVFFLAVITSCTAIDVGAMPVNVWVEPALADANNKLEPWFKEIQQRIRQQPSFQFLVQSIGCNKYVTCKFELQQNGDIRDLKLVEISGSDVADQAILDLVRKTAPFKRPPNELPYKRGMVISFSSPSSQTAENPVICLLRWPGRENGEWRPLRGNRFE
jgi:TonB family protein